ncbi:glycosyltransferase family 4 protein [Geobacter sp.]|uniref:glycosyltransferase family 4 protein n=1 Tax=Geobacter sp. TaxID=46610 RepID=UPI0026297749|nr:glycosyltransferase family 4 protein [Geobacter sp.]
MKRVLLLTRYGNLGASSRLRFYQYLPYLESHGYSITVAPLFGNDYVRGLYQGRIPTFSVLRAYIRRLGFMLQSGQFDLVWVEKEMLPWVPGLIEIGFFPPKVPLLVDYDDAVFHRYDLHRFPIVRTLLGSKIDSIMQLAEVVIVGNPYLRDRAKQAKAKRIEMIPTVVDASRYAVALTAIKQPVTIGWIGSPATDRYLSLVMSVIQKTKISHNIRAVAVGASGEHLAGSSIEIRAWTDENEVAEIQQFDIGIMPLHDEEWERGKCGYKLIQYMACGKPVVASPVGVNSIIVQHGVNGFLARNELEWLQAFELLCNDPLLRQNFGRAGRAHVEKEYSLDVMAPKLEEVLRSV